MDEVDYRKEYDFATSLVKEVYEKYNRLTKLDVNAVKNNIEEYMLNKIKQKFPNDNIIKEDYCNLKGRNWIIEAIDGINNFASRICMYGIGMALIVDEEIVLSVIYLPFFQEIYSAIKGDGAYLNDREINVKSKPLNKAIITLDSLDKENIDLIDSCLKSSLDIRLFGSTCLSLAYLASGKVNGCLFLKPNLKSLAPGLLLALEAGAIFNKEYSLTDFNSKYLYIASDEEMLKVLGDKQD